MRVQPIIINSNINRQNPKFGCNIYKPNTLLHKISPVISYMDKLFDKSVTVSRFCWHDKNPQISKYIKEIKTKGWQNSENVMWDINKDNRQKYVIIMHGLSHNISCLQDLYSNIVEKTNFGILAPEYSGLTYSCREKTYLEPKNLLKDASVGLEYLRKKGIEDKNIYVLGHSFGGFVATELAEKNKDLGGLILVSTTDTFKHRAESIKNGYTELVPPKIKKIIQISPIARLFMTSVFSTSKHMRKVNVPTDFIHCEKDNLVKIKNIFKLALKSKHLDSFVVLKEGGHKMDKNKINAIVEMLNRIK
ncbi:MAG: alpha/beta fold hydrolase [bacterium]|nr:alpha/beta fold hydrolase [bacterium]